MTRHHCLSFAAAVLALGTVSASAEGAVNSVIFNCERGVSVPVTFINTPDGQGYAVAQIDGRQVAMAQVVSGSGIRYRAIDPDQPYEFSGKGDAGFFAYGPEEDSAVLLGDCIAE